MSVAVTGRPVSDDLFDLTGPTPRLLCGRCDDCGTWTFPRADSCPRCSGRSVRTAAIEGPGRLWSWTIQHFRPKEPYDGPEAFEPFGVGYIEFEDRILIEGRLVGGDPQSHNHPYDIGQLMDICVVPYRSDAAGDVLTFAFRPRPGCEGR